MLFAVLLVVLTGFTEPALASAEVAVSSIAIERVVESAPRDDGQHRHVDYTLRYTGPGAIDYEIVDADYGCAVRFTRLSGSETRRCAL